MFTIVAAQFGSEHGEGVAMQGSAGVSRGWEATGVAFAVIAAGLFSPARSQGVDVALLVQQTPPSGGVITPSPGVHFFALNSEIVLTAVPNPGYKFIYWLGNVGDPTANHTITYLNKPKIVIAIFEPVEDGSLFMGGGSVGGGRVTSGGLVAAADYGGWGQTSPASSGSRPSESQAPNLYQQVVEPLPPAPSEYPIWPEPVTPSEPPIPEPATGILLLLGSLFVIPRKRKGAVLLLLFILCLVPSANAGLFISVNGVIEPPLAEITLEPDQTAILGINGDGFTPARVALYLLVEGPGSIDRATMIYRGTLAAYQDFPDWENPSSPEEQLQQARELLGRPELMDLSFITFANGAIPPAPLDGLLVDDIILHCDAAGDVTLSLISDDFTILYDTQVIQQVPEPMTLLLLGAGSLFAATRRLRNTRASQEQWTRNPGKWIF